MSVYVQAQENSPKGTASLTLTINRTYHWQTSSLNLPKYLAKIGYKNPQDPKQTNYADWSPEKLDFFSKCMAEPAYQDAFSGFMRVLTTYKQPWPEFFDTASLVDGAELGLAPLSVDVGGHHGVDLSRLLDKHPDLPAGSLILQDLPDCLSEVRGLNEKITIMPHNMFEEQPIKGTIDLHLVHVVAYTLH